MTLRQLALSLSLSSLAACGTSSRPTGGDGGAGLGPIDPRFEECATAVTSAEVKPAYLMFVLDGSNSMRDDHKWDAVVPALKALFADFAQRADPAIAAGLLVYADSRDTTGAMGVYGPYPQSIDVPIGFVDSAAPFDARLSGEPMGLTPTYEALSGAYAALRDYQPSGKVMPGGKKIAVLMTDGFPFSAIPSDQQVMDSLKEAKDALAGADPIFTFAVGIGTFPSGDLVEYDPTFLGRIADAGGTKRSASCNPTENADVSNVCYFQVTPSTSKPADQLKQEFVAALDGVRKAALVCDFQIGMASGGQSINPDKVNISWVTPDGLPHTISKDDKSGWSYDDPARPTLVRLNGSACDMYRQRGGTVSVVLGCDSLIL